jgi:hypothetical protein
MSPDKGHFSPSGRPKVRAQPGQRPFSGRDIGTFAQKLVYFSVCGAVDFFEFLVFIDHILAIIFHVDLPDWIDLR